MELPVLFHLWKDALDIEHGLIVDMTDLSTQIGLTTYTPLYTDDLHAY